MHDRIYDGVLIAEIAEHFEISTAHLRKVFSDLIGITPKKYYNWARMYEARRLLVSGESVQQVAKSLRYSDQFHFSRVFKHHFGRSPKSVVYQSRANAG